MHLQTGTYLQGGRYRIEKVLGQGGFGITYSGIQTNLEAKVAIKEFFMKDLCNRDSDTSQVSVGSVGSRETVERFRQKFIKEARNIFRLKHRHIIPVIDVFEENGTAYYVMEHVGGGSLADKVRGGALPESVAVRYIRQVAAALDFVHSKRMMHLDVKPANILLSDDDKAVLIDFGLAKQYDDDGQQTSSTPVGISHGYAPIEQYKRGGVSQFSPATDIYSLGATLFKLVTGVTPPEASDVNDEGLPALPSEISPAVRAAIEAAMEPRRKDRPQSIADFLELIRDSKASKDPKEETIAPKVSKDSKDPNDDLISPDEVEITAVPNGYVNEETRVVTKDPKDSKDPKETNTPKAPDYIETIKGGLLAVVAVAVAVLLCVGIWWYVNDNSDGGYDSYSASSSSYTSYDSNSDSNVDEQRVREEQELTTFTVKGVSFKMVAVDGGTFQMGATNEQQNACSDERPVHSVTLGSYYIGETEVTQELWQAVMGSNPSSFTGNSQRPVECVSWNDCQTFVNKLNDLLAGQLPAGRRFRLPTEAEWEYAARGGNRSRGTQYSGSNSIDNVAWYWDNSGSTTHPVKGKSPNELGLYDMTGNVWEWCEDYYDSDYYSTYPCNNPQGPLTGFDRVLRGCSWYDNARDCRVAFRCGSIPDNRDDFSGGLRLAL